MTLHPYLTASLIIQAHAAAASIALILGPALILRLGGRGAHRALGYSWVLAMALAALSSFGITGFGIVGPFSPIHLLSILALYSIWQAMSAIWRGDVATHRAAMRGLYARGVCVAAAFNFLPGRVVNRMVFPGTPEAGYIPLALILCLILWDALRRRAAQVAPA